MSTTPSRFETHAGLFRLLSKGIFDAYVPSPFGKKFILDLVTRVRTRNSTVIKNCQECCKELHNYHVNFEYNYAKTGIEGFKLELTN